MSEAGKIYELAGRCMLESFNWEGSPMQQGLRDIAASLTAHAQAIEAQRAGTTEIGPVGDESAVAASDAPKGV